MRLPMLLSLMLAASAAVAAPSIKAPATAQVGSQLTLEATGNGDGHDFVTVVPKGSPEGTYDQYVYVKPGKLQLQLPAKPGDYELRVLRSREPVPHAGESVAAHRRRRRQREGAGHPQGRRENSKSPGADPTTRATTSPSAMPATSTSTTSTRAKAAP